MTDSANPIPGTEETQTPGLIPETPNTTYIPPDTSGVGGMEADLQIGYDDTHAQPPVDPNSDTIHQDLLQDPNYAIHIHESQLNRIIETLEMVAERINHLEERFNDMHNRFDHLEEISRFDTLEIHGHAHKQGPPEPPSGTDYGTTA